MRVNKWDKFYKVKEDDSIEFLRLLRIKNTDCYVMLNDKKERIKLTAKELSGYVKLRPDGYINYSIVSLQKGNDVIVSMFKREDIESGSIIPYCICRQNIFDVFTNNFEDKNGIKFVGCSVSKDTCPADINYNMVMGCNSMIENINVSMYVDDSLEDLLEPITLLNFDDTLFKNYIANKSDKVQGYCKRLKDLLVMNNFMYDVLKAFDILRVPFKLEYSEDTKEISVTQRSWLEQYYKVEMLKTLIIPFTKEIDLKKIERDHIIVSDSDNKIFIILYDKGAYLAIDSQREIRNVRDQIMQFKKENNLNL